MSELKEEKIKKEIDEISPVVTIYLEVGDKKENRKLIGGE